MPVDDMLVQGGSMGVAMDQARRMVLAQDGFDLSIMISYGIAFIVDWAVS
jgi:hypothetical protein